MNRLMIKMITACVLCMVFFSSLSYGWQSWRFPPSCKECRLEKKVVSHYPIVSAHCLCLNRNGQYKDTTLVIRKRGFRCFVLSNHNGHLRCSPRSPKAKNARCYVFQLRVKEPLNSNNIESLCSKRCFKKASVSTSDYTQADVRAGRCFCKRCY